MESCDECKGGHDGTGEDLSLSLQHSLQLPAGPIWPGGLELIQTVEWLELTILLWPKFNITPQAHARVKAFTSTTELTRSSITQTKFPLSRETTSAKPCLYRIQIFTNSSQYLPSFLGLVRLVHRQAQITCRFCPTLDSLPTTPYHTRRE